MIALPPLKGYHIMKDYFNRIELLLQE